MTGAKLVKDLETIQFLMEDGHKKKAQMSIDFLVQDVKRTFGKKEIK
jgi:hypothetical protein